MKKILKCLIIFIVLGILTLSSSIVLADTISDGGIVGTVNLNNTSQNSAKYGDILKLPEIGWKRYDDIDSKIFYTTNSWIPDPVKDGSGNYKDTAHVGNEGDKYTVRFFGTKFRIISALHKEHSDKIKVTIDGVEYLYSEYLNQTTVIRSALLFEKVDLPLGVHNVIIENMKPGYAVCDAIDVDSTGYLLDAHNILIEGITLNKTTDSLKINDTDQLAATITPDNATNKTVKWTSSDESIATVDSTGKVTALKAGTATITATAQDGTNKSATCTVTVNSANPTLDITSEKSKVNGGDTFTTYVALHNVTNIYAEDIRVNYDSNLFEFVNADVAKDGYEIYNQSVTTSGAIRFIVANKGENNGITGESQVLKLTFKAKNVSGKGKIEPSYGLVANGLDGTETETTCVGTEVEVVGSSADVNKDGKSSLADLAIDARHFNMDKSKWDTKYNVDVVTNGQVDEADLKAVVQAMLDGKSSL